MSMLDRFRKKGGFEQLQLLLETSVPSKRDQLLELIEKEDSGWAVMLRTRLLTIDAIFSWDVETLKLIVPHINDRILAYSIIDATEEEKHRISQTMTQLKWDEVNIHWAKTRPGQTEIYAAQIQIVSLVRKLDSEGYIRFIDIDPKWELISSMVA
ncbi:MAG: FliG C-terminal domain-containing protein [Bdellovibrionales bacterium]